MTQLHDYIDCVLVLCSYLSEKNLSQAMGVTDDLRVELNTVKLQQSDSISELKLTEARKSGLLTEKVR